MPLLRGQLLNQSRRILLLRVTFLASRGLNRKRHLAMTHTALLTLQDVAH